MDIREFQELLGDMLDELPEPFFDELNGGVIVSPHAKENPHSQGGDLYILGESRFRLFRFYYLRV